ncbi:E3 ubiquitin-protein transferase MAEA-like isoform X2 [Amphibalanus amphitrite]|uniref:E3 ubiquitin-protein transferase MAEA-like isoform X2 n=1 Tax=Amphibalanus amphitrite TaxID=1232801 RepID=UPI001C8FCAA7|nr:E3 ubiquitin-protein transferase MAEA-like isoform X2 [Amphibalanus amphitrite]
MVDGRGNNSMRLAEVKVLEHPTLKVPYEMLNKKFRSSQKTLDRELAHFCSSASDLESSLHHSSVTVADVSRLLGSVTDRLRALKRKSEESICDELQSAELCRRRLQHLMEYGSQSAGLLSQWKRQRLDRLLVDHFVRCGFYELAVNLARHSQIEPLTNIDIFLVASQVENSLRRKDTGPALAWCYDNKSKLRKGRSKLELRLRQQEFIELVRAERRIEAVMHARKHLSNMDDYQGEDIQSCMALLAFPVDTGAAGTGGRHEGARHLSAHTGGLPGLAAGEGVRHVTSVRRLRSGSDRARHWAHRPGASQAEPPRVWSPSALSIRFYQRSMYAL